MDMTCDLVYAQKSVLGSILIDADLVASVLLRVRPADFTDEHLRTVFIVMQGMYNAGEVIDPVAVSHKCGKGYFDVVKACMEEVPTTANLPLYIDILLEQSKLRQLSDLLDPIAAAATLDEAREYVDKANALLVARADISAMGMEQGLVRFMERQAGKVKADYLDWGFEVLNRKMYIQAGDFVIVGGDPSTGKTAFSIGLALRHSESKRVGYFSLETSADKIFDRMMAGVLSTSLARIKKTDLDDDELRDAASAVGALAGNTFEAIDAAGWTVADIETYARSRRFDIVYVDYLQLISAPGKSRTEIVTNVSIGLHTMAQSNKMIVVALSQLSRGEKGGGAEASMSDLRESGQIEQDADAVFIFKLAEKGDYAGGRYLNIVKNKEGERGRILLDFDGETQTFSLPETSGNVAAKYSGAGRKVKQDLARNAKETHQQLEFQELPSGEAVPFEQEEAQT
ncbi:MAG: DnaB-like helicase C-terminal domain-containing protein [Oscillospiraceae bacterium]